MQQPLAFLLDALEFGDVLKNTDGSRNNAHGIAQRRDVRQHIDAGKVGTLNHELTVNKRDARREHLPYRRVFGGEWSPVHAIHSPRIQK